MTLRTKTTLIVSLSFLCLIALLLSAAMVVVQGRFRILENDEARRNGERARDALSDQVTNIAATTGDWAHWDDSARFVQGREARFPDSNLMDDTFLTLRLDVIVYIGADGRVVYQRWFDRGTRTTTAAPQGFARAIAPGSPLVMHPGIGSHHEGLLVLPGVLLLAASQPITNSLRSLPAVGVVVFGRIMDTVEMGRLSGIIQQKTRLFSADDSSLPPQARKALAQSDAGRATLVLTHGRDRIISFVPLKDVDGEPRAVMTVSAPRPLYSEGLRSIRYLAGSLIACSLLSALLLFLLLSRKVLTPLGRLAETVRRIGAAGGEARLVVSGRDELSEVAASINGMLDELGEAQDQRARLEEQLSHAHKLEAIGTLAGGVAHDFNNILMAITGFCDLLEDSLKRGTDGWSEVKEIRTAAARAASLTSQLLAFGRRQRLRYQVLDLNGLLSDMAGMLRRLLGDHVSLELAVQPGLAAIKADPGQVQQVIMNLAVNARDAMPAGGTLRIATKHVTECPASGEDRADLRAGPWVLCTVSDTGAGMDEAVRSRIFEPFYTTKELGRGTGLGLSVVWGIVKQIDGVITVASTPGQGTTFEIYLPVTDEAVPETKPRPSASSAAACAGTILVAEDDAAIRRFLVAALAKAGYRTIEAADGVDALRRAEEQGGGAIQLLVSDVAMPRMGGLILAQSLRAKHPSLKVLFISGNAELMSAGGKLPSQAMVLQKPFDTRQFLHSVRSALEEDAVAKGRTSPP